MKKNITDGQLKLLYEILSVRVLKKDIMRVFSVGERDARRMINRLRKTIPVISFSSNAGYRRAKRVRDLEDVNYAIAELRKRIKDLILIMNPLENWRDECEHAIAKFKEEGINEQDYLDREINTGSRAFTNAEWHSCM